MMRLGKYCSNLQGNTICWSRLQSLSCDSFYLAMILFGKVHLVRQCMVRRAERNHKVPFLQQWLRCCFIDLWSGWWAQKVIAWPYCFCMLLINWNQVRDKTQKEFPQEEDENERSSSLRQIPRCLTFQRDEEKLTRLHLHWDFFVRHSVFNFALQKMKPLFGTTLFLSYPCEKCLKLPSVLAEMRLFQKIYRNNCRWVLSLTSPTENLWETSSSVSLWLHSE